MAVATITAPELTLDRVDVRAVVVPLRRPVVSKVGNYERWPVLLIDVYTAEGVVGRSYLEPYLVSALGFLASLINEMAETAAGELIRPSDDFDARRRKFNLVGYEGAALIAISGLDMAAWDALAKAAGLPLARLLGGAAGPVPAYNSNGLWLREPSPLHDEAAELVEEGGFSALKLRLGRERTSEDVKALHSVRKAVGASVDLMVDFNQGLGLDQALRLCHALDDEGLCWFEEPLMYNDLSGHARLTRELATPIQLGENFYGPRELWRALNTKACDLVMPDP
jgi:mandelate racemase